MNAYLDSSVVLRLVLGEPGRFAGWRDCERTVCSDLVEVECLRTLDRLRLQRVLSDEVVAQRREAVYGLLRAAEVVEISRQILARAAEPSPVALGTLDAIHLATALAWQIDQGEPLGMVTHDRALGQAARAYGMTVVG